MTKTIPKHLPQSHAGAILPAGATQRFAVGASGSGPRRALGLDRLPARAYVASAEANARILAFVHRPELEALGLVPPGAGLHGEPASAAMQARSGLQEVTQAQAALRTAQRSLGEAVARRCGSAADTPAPVAPELVQSRPASEAAAASTTSVSQPPAAPAAGEAAERRARLQALLAPVPLLH